MRIETTLGSAKSPSRSARQVCPHRIVVDKIESTRFGRESLLPISPKEVTLLEVYQVTRLGCACVIAVIASAVGARLNVLCCSVDRSLGNLEPICLKSVLSKHEYVVSETASLALRSVSDSPVYSMIRLFTNRNESFLARPAVADSPD